MAGINIPIVSSLGGKGFEQAILQLKALETNGERAGFVLNKAFLPAIGALGALAAAGGFAVKAAIEDQESQVQLAQALKNTVGASDEVVAATEKMITQMSRASGVADDELRPAFAQLVRGTGSLTKAQEAMSLAMDIQAGTGQDLRTVTDALASAYAGNLKGLKGLSPEITKMIRDGDGLSAVIKVLGNNFQGAADVAGKSAKGQLALMNGAFTDMKESLGMALLPALEAVIPMLVKFSDWAANHVNVIIAIGTGIAGIATAIAVYVGVQKAANAVMIVATALNWAMAASETAKNTAMTLGVGAAAIAAGLVVAMGALTIYKNKTKDLTVAQVEQNNVAKDTATGIGTTSELLFASNAMQLKAAYAAAYATQEIKKEEKGFNGLSDAAKKAESKLKKLKKAAEDAAEALREETAKAVKEASDALNTQMADALDTAKNNLTDAQDAYKEYSNGVSTGILSTLSFAKVLTDADEKSKKLTDAVKETAKAVASGLKDSLAKAQTELTKTKTVFNDFAKTVSTGIKESFSFKKANEGPDGFITGLRDQVTAIKQYNDDIQALLNRGLSQDALKQILASGTESGAAIAKGLLAGAQDDITGSEGVNALVASVQETSDQLGMASAEMFYGEGVNAAQDYLDGIQTQFDQAMETVKAFETGKAVTTSFVEGLQSQIAGISQYAADINTLLEMGLSQDALQAVLDAGGESGAAIAHELVMGAQENITGPKGVNALVADIKGVAAAIGIKAADQFYSAGVTNAQEYLKGVEDAFAVAQARLDAAGSGLTIADIKGIGAGFFDQVANGYTATPLEQFMQDGGGLSADANGNIVYNINVSGVMSNAQTGQAVVDAITQYTQVYGPLNLAIR